MLALEGAASAVCRQHGLEVEDEGHLKDLDVTSVFTEVFLLMLKFYSKKSISCLDV
jgi:hypothetical protein